MLTKIIHVISNVLSHTYIDICGPVPIYIGVFLFIIMTGVLAKTVLEAMRRKKESQKFIERFRNMWTIREMVCIALVLMAGCLSLIQFDTTTAPDLSSPICTEDTMDINAKQEILSETDIQIEKIDEQRVSISSEKTYDDKKDPNAEQETEAADNGEQLFDEPVNGVATVLVYTLFACVMHALLFVFAIMDEKENKKEKIGLCICLVGAILFTVILINTISGVHKEYADTKEAQATESESDQYDTHGQIPYTLDEKIRQKEPNVSALNMGQQNAIKNIRNMTKIMILIIIASTIIRLLIIFTPNHEGIDMEGFIWAAHVMSGTLCIIFCIMFLQFCIALQAGVLNETASDVFGWKYKYIETENKNQEIFGDLYAADVQEDDVTEYTQENGVTEDALSWNDSTEQTAKESPVSDKYIYKFRVNNISGTTLRNVTLLDVTTDESAVEDWGKSSDETTGDRVLSPGERAVVTITQRRPLIGVPEVSGIYETATEKEEWFWPSIRLCKNILMTLFGAIAAFMTVLCFDTFYKHGRSTIYPIVRITAFVMLAGSLYKGTRAMVLMTALSAALFMTISIRKDAPGVQAANDFINTRLKRNDDEVKNDSGGIILS